MRKATFCLLVIATVTLLGGVPAENVPQADPAAKLDAVLQRAADSGAGSPLNVLVRMRSGAAVPAVPGVEFGGRFGDIATARVKAADLLRLASHRNVTAVRHATGVSLRGDVGNLSVLGYRGEISAAAETDSYTYEATAGEVVTITAHGEGAFDTRLVVTDAGADSGSGPGNDAQITSYTFATGGSKTITVGHETDSATGNYVLVVRTSKSLAGTELTGGDMPAADSAYLLGTGAATARATYGVDGTGVIIGFVDSGIDFANADFRNADGSTRLLYVWDQTLVAEPDELLPDDFGYGVEYDETMINNHLTGALPSYVRHVDAEGHGTHVAGIAAANGLADTLPVSNVGAAPGARLIMVKSLGSDANVLDGVNYIIGRGIAHQMPVVINLSLGGHDGPHDGTSMLDEALASIDRVGVGLVVAAGNEGDSSRAIHDQITIPLVNSRTFTYDPDDTAISFPGTTNHVVISEVQTASSVSDSDFEFVELYNPTDSPVVIGGWDLAYKSAFGTTWNEVVSFPQGSVIAAHGFFLIGGPSVTPTPDVITTNLGLGNTSGHVVLRDDDDKTVDLLGWGSADSPESNAAAAPASDGSMERDPGAASPTSGNGVDTGDNAADFTVRLVSEPQSTASATETPLPPHIIDIWAHGSDRYAVQVTDGTGAGTFSAGDGTSVTIRPDTPNREFTVDNRVDAPSNGANHIRLTLFHEGPLPGITYTIQLTRMSGSGNGVVDAYVANEPSIGRLAVQQTLYGDTGLPGTISQPGTAGGSVLTVGAFVSKFRWDHPAGTEEKAAYSGLDAMGSPVFGSIGLFSSRGPTRDGRNKPDVAAPGAWIASSLSSGSTPTAVNQVPDGTDADATSEYEHRVGSSMAAPAVAGVIALLLEHNPGLTTQGIKTLVQRSALADSQTDNLGPLGNNNHWGAGKVYAVGLLRLIPASVPMEVENSCVNAVVVDKAGSGGPARALLVLFLAVLLGRVFSLRRKVQEKAS